MKDIIKRFEQYLTEEREAKGTIEIISGLYICL